jgi:hypothetical protein
MDRRQFCNTAIAAGVAGSVPWWSACKPAEPGIAAVSLDGAAIELEAAAVRELGESLGDGHARQIPEYETRARSGTACTISTPR